MSSEVSVITAGRRMAIDRLRRYIADIIDKQNTPLSSIIRDRALPYLPLQSLHRFRCVSVSWNRHISAPFFAHQQSISHHSISGFFYHDIITISYLPLDPKAYSIPNSCLSFLPKPLNNEVVASSNGLIVCRSISVTVLQLYYICNPATRQWVELPRSSLRHNGGVVALIFQPSVLNFSAEFMLVCTVPRLFAIEVFSSVTGKWRRSNAVLPGKEANSMAVCVNGIAYWSVKRGVVCFDPVTERLEVFDFPRSAKRWVLGEVGGEVCGIVVEMGMMEVYLMDDRSWKKMWEVAVDGEAKAVALAGREETVVVWMKGKVMVVDVRSGEKRVVAEGVPEEIVDGVPYVSSMVTVKEFAGVTRQPGYVGMFAEE